MIKFAAVALAALVFCSETGTDWARDRAWANMTDQQRYECSVEYKARAARMTEEEFILLSSVVEAESDRSNNIEGRVLIAETILNRVESDLFPNTVTEVLCQPGQFSTVVGGHSVTNRTNLSDAAIFEAIERIENGTAPRVMFFNCIGYNYGTPYDYVGGNYFMTM